MRTSSPSRPVTTPEDSVQPVGEGAREPSTKGRRGDGISRERLTTLIGSSLLLVALLLLWHIAVATELVNEIVVAPPIEVGKELVILLQEPFFYENLWVTSYAVIVGFILGAVIGFVMGAALGMSDLLRRVSYPYVVAFQGLPKIALAPLFVAAFGFGVESKIAMAVAISFFPLLVNTVAGLLSVDQDAVKLMRVMTASRLQIFTKLALPHSLPQIFAGLKTSLTLALVGALVGEFVGASEGLGYLLEVSAYEFNIPRVYALTIILALIGVILFMAIELVDRKVVTWQGDRQLQSGA